MLQENDEFLSGLFPSLFGFRMSALGSGILNLRIDLSAQQDGHTRDIKPQQQNDHRAQRSVCLAITVEEVQVYAEEQGSADPGQNANH